MNIQKKIPLTKDSGVNSSYSKFGCYKNSVSSNPIGAQLVRISPSYFLLAMVLLLHLIATIAIFLSRIDVLWLALGIATLIAHGYFYFTAWLRFPIYRLQQSQDGLWFFYNERDKVDFFAIKRCYYWSRYLIIFYTESSQGKSTFFPIFPDSCRHKQSDSTSNFRHIRIVAKYFL
ncbi:MAG: protein YgfX [Cellvibrionaceae bacterium]